jgi:hypothetical protein
MRPGRPDRQCGARDVMTTRPMFDNLIFFSIQNLWVESPALISNRDRIVVLVLVVGSSVREFMGIGFSKLIMLDRPDPFRPHVNAVNETSIPILSSPP